MFSSGKNGPNDNRNAGEAAGAILRAYGGQDTHGNRKDLLWWASTGSIGAVVTLVLLYSLGSNN